MKIPVMIVEDERIVSMEIESFLIELGYEVVCIASNSEEALSLALKFKPHIILMDIKIDGKHDGISTINMIQEHINPGIIYITAYYDDNTVDRAIETNPCAYLIKPFNKKELFASLKLANLTYNKENKNHKIGNILFDKEFSFDSINKQLIFNGERIHLTKRELQLLELFLRKKEAIVSIYEIENEIWPDKLANENTRRALVSRLRAKMKYKFVETVPSLGYRINI